MALAPIRIHTSNSSFEAIYLSTSFPFFKHTCEVSSLMLSQTNSFPFATSFENMSSSPAQFSKPPNELRLKFIEQCGSPERSSSRTASKQHLRSPSPSTMRRTRRRSSTTTAIPEVPQSQPQS
ncbi:hypothetical protein QC762_0077960 [Podospora pseudocomata]|uniref:Uncharacterized protein n=1 Tax=Podospora pseudocomata TaxID=2093779 RepID=A0ABR0GAX5_9PEZI|nr:hypothetical protein QC762_0077960 [Podospora pseudocomata]